MDAGSDAGLAYGGKDGGSLVDGGRDAGAGDSGPSVVCWDAGALNSGSVWTGFSGTCATLVAPLAWCSNWMDLCPLPDGGAVLTDLRGDARNCGACGLTCVDFCDLGQCNLDETGHTPYSCAVQAPDGSTVSLLTTLEDDDNCGGCGCPCAPGQQCAALVYLGRPPPMTPWGAQVPIAECVPNCPDAGTPWERPCLLPDGGAECADLHGSDNQNCGGCGIVCATGNCVDGSCG